MPQLTSPSVTGGHPARANGCNTSCHNITCPSNRISCHIAPKLKSRVTSHVCNSSRQGSCVSTLAKLTPVTTTHTAHGTHRSSSLRHRSPHSNQAQYIPNTNATAPQISHIVTLISHRHFTLQLSGPLVKHFGSKNEMIFACFQFFPLDGTSLSCHRSFA